ncbi:MAG: hypothetical protein AB7S38_32125 [Vulcanimicrobiota bacterium]
MSSDYLMEGSTAEAARANFEDRELLQQFKEVDRLPDEKKAFIKRVLDALVVKEKLRELLHNGQDDSSSGGRFAGQRGLCRRKVS